ncbi:TrmH family RNA methyltransferase [Ornithinibacillus bavariensis]|uniref:TrmH family RNA methyltransferase n=1 Tax=Ornithinibacillus bavariensis TaxID=545502 RepID=UPI000EC3D861|nr:TrmH family RNA methyltransferase [Ornithinibacillus sp.]
MTYKLYKKEYDYSYSLGVFPTIELLQNHPKTTEKVLLHPNGNENQGVRKIVEFCNQHGILVETNEKLVSKLSRKDNCYAIGIFSKQSMSLSNAENHIALVNPSDMGNLGTIIRTVVGFGITNIAIIRPAVDAYNPRVIRGSMGAFFKTNIQFFDNFQEYLDRYNNDIYTLRLNGLRPLNKLKLNVNRPYTIVFGNEGSGLGDDFDDIGTGIVIPHNEQIDSLNLAVAVGITVHHFTNCTI